MRRNKEKGIHKWDMRITGKIRIALRRGGGGGGLYKIIFCMQDLV